MSELKKLSQKVKDYKKLKAVVGFDGFVDEIVHVVDIRHNAENYDRIDNMKAYAERIQGGCGLSTNIEIVTVQEKMGGNGPIYANALMEQSIDVTYIGCVGEAVVQPVFESMKQRGRVIALADPSHTDAYEFNDGKVIISKLSNFNHVTWERILDRVGLEEFRSIIDESDLISMNNWTMLPHMSDIWKRVLSDVVPFLNVDPKSKTMFFDLADPEKRKQADILEALDLIGEFTDAGFETILGLNKKEACEVAELFGTEITDYKEYPLRELVESIYKNLNLSRLVVHPVDCACSIDKYGYASVPGPYCEKPIITTGAGDHFNAGYIIGVLNGNSQKDSLLRGVYSSGYYVRKGHSPSVDELAGFIENYGD